MAVHRVTVAVLGPPGSGKSLIAEIILDALRTAGINADHDPNNGSFRPRSLDELWNRATVQPTKVQILEKEVKDNAQV